MKVYILTLFFFLNPVLNAATENNGLDSLLKSLKTTDSDTGKIMLYYRISYEYQKNDIELSLQYAERAYNEALKINFRKGTAYSLIQLGNISQIRADYKRAEEYNLQALDIILRLNDKAGEAICLNNLGIIYHNQSDFRKALDYYNRSLEVNRELDRQSGEAISLFCIGTVYENMAKYDSALLFYFDGQKIGEGLNDINLIAYGDVSLANVYYSMQDYKQSREYNENALALYEKAGNKLGVIKVLNSLGQIAVLHDSLGMAVRYYKGSLAAGAEIGSISDVSYSLFSLAQVYEQMEKTDSALIMYTQAHDTYASLGNEENEAYSLISMARMENLRENYEKAGGYLIEAYNIADSLGAPKLLMEAEKEIALTFYGLEDFRSAFLYYRNYSGLKDSVMNLEKQNQILELQTRYETDKKEKENTLLKQEQKLLQTTRNFLIAGAGMLAIIIFLILRSLSIKKRDNELLRKQKEEIRLQKEIVEEQKRDITDSIRYARRIQTAILPSEETVKSVVPDSFILYLPREIVSGDFYFFRNLDKNNIVFCAADCTGHGVPGAFMSMLGLSLLGEIVTTNHNDIISGQFKPSDILNSMREGIKLTLGQTGREGEAKDGMDMSLCVINKDQKILQYAGANNPVYIVANGILTEIKATRNPVGIYVAEKEFINNTITLEPCSVVYLFSDGYSDQISPVGSKFLSKNLKRFLEEISGRSLEEQKEILLQRHLSFRGSEVQVDDILLMGVLIK